MPFAALAAVGDGGPPLLRRPSDGHSPPAPGQPIRRQRAHPPSPANAGLWSPGLHPHTPGLWPQSVGGGSSSSSSIAAAGGVSSWGAESLPTVTRVGRFGLAASASSVAAGGFGSNSAPSSSVLPSFGLGSYSSVTSPPSATPAAPATCGVLGTAGAGSGELGVGGVPPLDLWAAAAAAAGGGGGYETLPATVPGVAAAMPPLAPPVLAAPPSIGIGGAGFFLAPAGIGPQRGPSLPLLGAVREAEAAAVRQAAPRGSRRLPPLCRAFNSYEVEEAVSSPMQVVDDYESSEPAYSEAPSAVEGSEEASGSGEISVNSESQEWEEVPEWLGRRRVDGGGGGSGSAMSSPSPSRGGVRGGDTACGVAAAALQVPPLAFLPAAAIEQGMLAAPRSSLSDHSRTSAAAATSAMAAAAAAPCYVVGEEGPMLGGAAVEFDARVVAHARLPALAVAFPPRSESTTVRREWLASDVSAVAAAAAAPLAPSQQPRPQSCRLRKRLACAAEAAAAAEVVGVVGEEEEREEEYEEAYEDLEDEGPVLPIQPPPLPLQAALSDPQPPRREWNVPDAGHVPSPPPLLSSLSSSRSSGAFPPALTPAPPPDTSNTAAGPWRGWRVGQSRAPGQLPQPPPPLQQQQQHQQQQKQQQQQQQRPVRRDERSASAVTVSPLPVDGILRWQL